ncbi:MAG: hypothetical protein K6343_01050 [Caldisericaceae bacterium]
MKNMLDTNQFSFTSTLGYVMVFLQGFLIITLFAIALTGERHPWWGFAENIGILAFKVWLALILITLICWFIEFRKQKKTVISSILSAFGINLAITAIALWFLGGFFYLKTYVVEYLNLPSEFYIWYEISCIGIIAGLLNLIPITRRYANKIISLYLLDTDKESGPPLKTFLGIFAQWLIPFILIIPFSNFPFHKRKEFAKRSLPSAIASGITIVFENIKNGVPIIDVFGKYALYAMAVLPLSFALGFIYLLLLEEFVRTDYSSNLHRKNVIGDSLLAILTSLGLLYILFHLSFIKL